MALRSAGRMYSALPSPASLISPLMATMAVCALLGVALGNCSDASTQTSAPTKPIQSRLRSRRQRRAARRSRNSANSNFSIVARSQGTAWPLRFTSFSIASGACCVWCLTECGT